MLHTHRTAGLVLRKTRTGNLATVSVHWPGAMSGARAAGTLEVAWQRVRFGPKRGGHWGTAMPKQRSVAS